MKSVTFIVDGISCQTCISHIEKAVSGKDGVESITVNLANSKATVEYDDKKIKLSEIFKTIESIGYSPKKITNEVIDENEENAKKKLKKEFFEFKIAVSFGIIILYMSMGIMIGLPLPQILNPNVNATIFTIVQLLLSIPVIIIGRKFYINGIKKLLVASPSMDTLIALGTGAAFLYSFYGTVKIIMGNASYVHNLYYEAGVIILSLIILGKYLENRSKRKTSEAIRKLMGLQTKIANLCRGNEIISVSIDEIEVGDVLLIKPGESIATDGEVIEGKSNVNESMLTGESVPVKKLTGSKVYGATINGTGSLKIKATAIGENTVLSKIIKLIENAQGSKAPIAKLADVVSGYFVPFVIVIAVASSLIWYIVGKLELISLNSEPSIFALTILISVLVIACPCSLGLATPTAIMVGTGRGAELGILIKSAEALEKLCKVNTVVFDKTGTLTIGEPVVTNIISSVVEEDELIRIAGSLEQNSEHPLAKSILKEVKKRNLELFKVSNFNSVTGEGIIGNIDNEKYLATDIIIGNSTILKNNEIELKEDLEIIHKLLDEGKTVIYIATKEKYLGMIAIADKVRENSKEVIEKLKKINIETVMLTGDNKKTALAIAKEIGIKNVISEVSPEQKFLEIKKLQLNGKKVAMIGDGINDSPALTQADIGIAVGGGAEIALESADIVLMSQNIKDIPKAIELSRATIKNIKENLFWAFIYNGLGIPVAAGLLYPFTGHLLNPMIAGAAMAMSSVSVVSNALRLKWFR